jgi:hypothetical protein
MFRGGTKGPCSLRLGWRGRLGAIDGRRARLLFVNIIYDYKVIVHDVVDDFSRLAQENLNVTKYHDGHTDVTVTVYTRDYLDQAKQWNLDRTA